MDHRPGGRVETAQEYVARLLDLLGSDNPLDVLEMTPWRLSSLLSRFPEERLPQRPMPTRWSASEIAIHLFEVEMVVGVRIRLVVGKCGIVIQSFDQDEWARRYQSQDLNGALTAFRALRRMNLHFYRSLTPEQLNHYGIHDERGRESALQMLKICAAHDLNHLKQLEYML